MTEFIINFLNQIQVANPQSAEYKAYTIMLRAEVKNSKSAPSKRAHQLAGWRGRRTTLMVDIRTAVLEAFGLSQKIAQMDAQVARDNETRLMLEAGAQDDIKIAIREANLADLRAAKRRRVDEARAHRRGEDVEQEDHEDAVEEEVKEDHAEGRPMPPLEAPPVVAAPVAAPVAAQPLVSPTSPYGPEIMAAVRAAIYEAMNSTAPPVQPGHLSPSSSSSGGGGSTSSVTPTPLRPELPAIDLDAAMGETGFVLPTYVPPRERQSILH